MAKELFLALGDLTTGEIEEIDIEGLPVGIASISPDGSEISFVDEDEGLMWLMDIDGTGMRRALGAQYQTTVTAWRPRSLELPTPLGRQLGSDDVDLADRQRKSRSVRGMRPMEPLGPLPDIDGDRPRKTCVSISTTTLHHSRSRTS